MTPWTPGFSPHTRGLRLVIIFLLYYSCAHACGKISFMQPGKFELSAGKFYGDEKLDQGAKTSQDARFYGMSAAFAPVSNV